MNAPVVRFRLRTQRYQALLVAGWLVVALAAGTAALPLLERRSGAALIGGILLAAGVAELMAGTLRKAARIPSMAAGAVTILAGVLFLLRPETPLLPTAYVITAWLLARAIAVCIAGLVARGGPRRWSLISAATDLLLGGLLLLGLSIATLVVILFGPTPDVIASFSWFLAVSLGTTGLYLLEVGNCEREAATVPVEP